MSPWNDSYYGYVCMCICLYSLFGYISKINVYFGRQFNSIQNVDTYFGGYYCLCMGIVLQFSAPLWMVLNQNIEIIQKRLSLNRFNVKIGNKSFYNCAFRSMLSWEFFIFHSRVKNFLLLCMRVLWK